MWLVGDILDYINNETEVRALQKYYDSKCYIELEYYSSLGEDVVETIWFDEMTAESLLKALYESVVDYAAWCEEELKLFVSERPKGTENFTVRQLVDDADWKVAFWKAFVEDVINHFNGGK